MRTCIYVPSIVTTCVVVWIEIIFAVISSGVISVTTCVVVWIEIYGMHY